MFRSRYGKGISKKHDMSVDEGDEESANSEDEERSDREGRLVRSTKPAMSNHYTLNLTPNTSSTKPDLPYTLSGSVL